MKRVCLLLLLIGLLPCAGGGAAPVLLEQANRLELKGDFIAASNLLSRALADRFISVADRKTLEFEADRLERIKLDFPFTSETLFEAVGKSVKDLTRPEFDAWVREGRFDTRMIDGQLRFMAASVSNLFFRYPQLTPRRRPPVDTAAVERHHLEICEAIEKAVQTEKKPYVLPKRFEITMTVTVSTNTAPAGEVLGAWLPVPREYPFQTGLQVLASSSPVKHLADAESTIRSAYMEQSAEKDRATEFKLQYLYTTYGVRFDIHPETIGAATTPLPAELVEFTREAPHIEFTAEMRNLSRKIAGEETNPYLQAKRFYDWISGNIQYSYATEYSTIRNISEYCRGHGYGDCGQEALLFMTLCRLNGIPARWQSGWNTFPGAKSIHDWTEIYLAPYGWVPVDPYMGIYAMRYANSLTAEQRRHLRDFYFGGLDQYRMSANRDHNQILAPPKKSMRSDNVDFQRGELEYGVHNIYFDRYSYQLDAKEVELPRGKME